MSRRDLQRMEHMLSHAREAVDIAHQRVREDLDRDRLLNLALVRLVEVVGEAAARVSDDCRARHADIPWIQIIGTRNRIVHGYDQVDFDILWEIVTTDLVELIPVLERSIQADRS